VSIHSKSLIRDVMGSVVAGAKAAFGLPQGAKFWLAEGLLNNQRDGNSRSASLCGPFFFVI
jgi:hypothetical protein